MKKPINMSVLCHELYISFSIIFYHFLPILLALSVLFYPLGSLFPLSPFFVPLYSSFGYCLMGIFLKYRSCGMYIPQLIYHVLYLDCLTMQAPETLSSPLLAFISF